MDAHARAVLEFETVRQALARHASSALARDVIERLEPSTDPVRLALSLAQLDQARMLLDRGDPLPVRGLRDVVALIAVVRNGNRVFEPSELFDVLAFLDCVDGLRRWLAQHRTVVPDLAALGEKLLDHGNLRRELTLVIDSPGVVRDDASPKLRDLRQRAAQLEDEARRLMDEIASSSRLRVHLQEKGWSVRNGRFVLPVRFDARGNVPGILHDKSATGSTVFIEPREVASLANELADTRLDADREVYRLLMELTQRVLHEETRLAFTRNVAAWLDFTAARAEFSREIGGASPRLSEDGVIRLRLARHPLLVLRNLGGSPVEPLTVELGRHWRMLVVTGPNTGGKTVVLKTIGLIQLMFQAGLHVPVGDGSELPVLSDVFADIGDEQSLAQNLSTFSGHVHQIARILAAANAGSLVLLDELGAGTDPVEGAALGEAVLDRLRASRALVATTTHLGALKGFAFSHPDVENASMEFDSATLRPTWRLLIGQPGNSHALEIASRHGMPPDVLTQAAALATGQRDASHDLIDGLRDSRVAADSARRHAEDLLAESRQRLAEAEAGLADARAEKQRLETEADASVRRLFGDFEQGARPHLNALHNVPRALLPEVEALERLLRDKSELPTLAGRRREFLAAVKKDDLVYVPRFEQLCRVKKMNRAEARLTVQVGVMNIELSFDDVSFVKPPVAPS